MRALQFTGTSLEVTDLPDPRPAPHQAVVAVRAAGLCHSDLTVMSRHPEAHAFGLPVVLGHELAGTVVEVGPGVTSLRVGDAVAGYGPRGCGRCRACAAGAENYCRDRPAGMFPPGLGAPGALAEYVAVDADHLVAADGLDPLQTAALTDAGLTAWHAIGRALPTARGTVVVIGVGGLGHAAVQILRHLGGVRVVAVDVTAEKLELAEILGADVCLEADQGLVDEVRRLTGGHGADTVLDFVASDGTLADAAAMLATDGVLSVVGVGTGRLPVAMHSVPLGTRVDLPFWGTRFDLYDVLALARSGTLRMEVSTFGLEETVEAYRLLETGAVLGRAVVRPDVATIGGESS